MWVPNSELCLTKGGKRRVFQLVTNHHMTPNGTFLTRSLFRPSLSSIPVTLPSEGHKRAGADTSLGAWSHPEPCCARRSKRGLAGWDEAQISPAGLVSRHRVARLSLAQFGKPSRSDGSGQKALGVYAHPPHRRAREPPHETDGGISSAQRPKARL